MKVLIAAGGTGGHIYPALALAERIRQKYPDSEIGFFGSYDRMEHDVIPAAGYEFFGFHMHNPHGGVMDKVKCVGSLVKAQRQCGQLIGTWKPDICVGFGNYISVPLIKAAHKAGIPTMLHEQNSFAGKANRMLSIYADGIVGCYETNLKQLGEKKTRILGNPSATLAADTAWNPAELEKMGLDSRRPFVLFMMGSLGSASVSKVIDEAIDRFDDYQVVIAAGASNEYVYRHESKGNVRIVEKVNGRNMLKGCEAAVLRAGATTMAEIEAIGTAAILIPSPYVPNNHQYFNAMELVNRDAAMILEEKDLNAESLAVMLNGLMKDRTRREQMKRNAVVEERKYAADRIIEFMEELTAHE